MEELNLYVENSTSRIYEGRLFPDFVIVRPVLSTFHNHIRKVDVVTFSNEFHDFDGDRNHIRTFLQGRYEPDPEADFPPEMAH